MSETTSLPAIPEEPKEKKSSKWIEGLKLAILVITVVFVVLTYWNNTKTPHLYYTVTSSLPIKGEKGQITTYELVVINDGSKEAKDVQGIFYLHGMSIQDKQLTPGDLNGTVKVNQEMIQFTVPLLNTQDKATLSFIGANTEHVPERPRVVVRSEGVTGDDKPVTFYLSAFTLAASTLAFILVSIYIAYSLITTGSRLQLLHTRWMASSDQWLSFSVQMRSAIDELCAALNTSKETIKTMYNQNTNLKRENEDLKAKLAAKANRPRKSKAIEPPKDAPESPSPEAT
jgi:hypothetical protein